MAEAADQPNNSAVKRCSHLWLYWKILPPSNKDHDKPTSFHKIVALYALSDKVSIHFSDIFSKYRNVYIFRKIRFNLFHS